MEGDSQRPSYLLKEFLRDVKKNKNKINLERKVYEDARNCLNLYQKNEILNYIESIPFEDFIFVNSKPYRKGINNDHPMVDSYKIKVKWLNLYLAFCFTKTYNGWFIKSFHSDEGETMSIAAITALKLELE